MSATSDRIVSILIVTLLFIFCSRNVEHVKFSPSEARDYVQELDASRLQKDTFLKSSPSSPLTPEQRTAFRHLKYYAPNLDLVFQTRLADTGHETRADIPATGGELRPALRVGEFEFETAGSKFVLHVYKMIGEDSEELFLPFTDETCGRTSYAGGRYLDLKENESGIYRLDFNYAYNPYCAYSHNFSCPIVPRENYLDVPIEAGEEMFK